MSRTKKFGLLLIVVVLAGLSCAAWSRAACPQPSQLFDENNEPLLSFVPVMLDPDPSIGNESISIVIGVPYQSTDTLDVITPAHQLVRRVFRGPLHAGMFRFCWNLDNQSGQRMPPGPYFFYRHGNFGRDSRLVSVWP